MLIQKLVLRDVSSQHVVGAQVASIESKEKVSKPGVRAFREGVEDRMKEKFAKVVYRVGNESCDAEIVSSRLLLFDGEFGDVDAGEVE